jgi:hypothetical protein
MDKMKYRQQRCGNQKRDNQSKWPILDANSCLGNSSAVNAELVWERK